MPAFSFRVSCRPRKNWFFQGTAQVYRGDCSDVFTANRPPGTSAVVGHLRIYRRLGESPTSIFGASYARGHTMPPLAQSQSFPFLTISTARMPLFVEAAPPRIYHASLPTELFWSAATSSLRSTSSRPSTLLVLYSDSEYRVNRRWTLAAALIAAARGTNAQSDGHRFFRYSYLFWPSEFARSVGSTVMAICGTCPMIASPTPTNFCSSFLFVMGAARPRTLLTMLFGETMRNVSLHYTRQLL